MADENLELGLTIDANAAVAAALKLMAEMGKIPVAATAAQGALDGVGKAGQQAGTAASQGLNQAASSADRAAKSAANAGDAFAKARGLMAFGAGVGANVLGSALDAYGATGGANYAKGIGGGAIQGAMAGAPLGAGGMAAGAAIGGIGGGLSAFFGEQKREREEAEALQRALDNLAVSGAAASRAIYRIDEPKQMEAAIRQLREELEQLQDRQARGLLPKGQEEAIVGGARDRLQYAEDKMPILQEQAAAGRVKEAQAALEKLKESMGDEAAGRRLADALAGPAQARIVAIDQRLKTVTERMAQARAEINDPAMQAGDKDKYADALQRYAEASREEAKLQDLRKQPAAATGGGPRNAQADSMTQIGAILKNGGLSAGTADYSRATSANTTKMVELLGRIEKGIELGKVGNGGAATWA